ncbi:hypothetical protein HDU67_008984, partial [Dinochytrium kinnereticum]
MSAADAIAYVEDAILSLETVPTFAEVKANKGNGKTIPPVVQTPTDRSARLKQVLNRYDCTSVSLHVLGKNAEPLWSQAYGERWSAAATAPSDDSTRTMLPDEWAVKPITGATAYQMASVSKPVTAVAVMRLVDQGLVDLDRDVNEYLTEEWKLKFAEVEVEFEKVTLRRLMAHCGGTCTSGFSGYVRKEVLEGKVTVPSTVEVLQGKGNSEAVEVIALPGVITMYSGGGTTIIQHIIEIITQKPFPIALHDLLLSPAGMASSTFELPLPGNLINNGDLACAHRAKQVPVEGGCCLHPESAAAGLWSSAEDMGVFLRKYWESLKGLEGAILSQEAAEAMLEPQGLSSDFRTGWACDEKDGRVMFQHGGANDGYFLHVQGFTDSGEGMVILISAPPDSRDVHSIRWVLKNAISEFYNFPSTSKQPARPNPDGDEDKKKEPVVTPERIQDLSGDYVFEGRVGKAAERVKKVKVETTEDEDVRVLFGNYGKSLRFK